MESPKTHGGTISTFNKIKSEFVIINDCYTNCYTKYFAGQSIEINQEIKR